MSNLSHIGSDLMHFDHVLGLIIIGIEVIGLGHKIFEICSLEPFHASQIILLPSAVQISDRVYICIQIQIRLNIIL